MKKFSRCARLRVSVRRLETRDYKSHNFEIWSEICRLQTTCLVVSRLLAAPLVAEIQPTSLNFFGATCWKVKFFKCFCQKIRSNKATFPSVSILVVRLVFAISIGRFQRFPSSEPGWKNIWTEEPMLAFDLRVLHCYSNLIQGKRKLKNLKTN